MNPLTQEFVCNLIEQRSNLFAKQTAAELACLELENLLTSKSAFWYQSQRNDAGRLISKLIEMRLETKDEAFTRSLLRELGVSGDESLHEEAITQLGKQTKERQRAISVERAHAENRLTRDFIGTYCSESFDIDWQKVVKLVAT